jgi:hypothetical protein
MNERHPDPRALEVLLNQPEIVDWLGLSEAELAALLESKRQGADKPPKAGK